MAKRLFGSTALFAGVLLLGALFSPAAAHHKSGHSNGGNGKAVGHSAAPSGGNSGGSSAGGSSGSGYTEDNDNNDGGTPDGVVDSGDNMHPSGKDKSVEHGNSGNQGNSSSDPDDDGRGPDRSNGGADKPNGPGGVDLADQDGNNGCGNDDDFEDDNEGWCGKHEKPAKDVKVKDKDKSKDDDEGSTEVDDDEVVKEADDVVDAFVDVYAPDNDTKVLGTTLVRPDTDASLDRIESDLLERSASETETEGGATLPFTGADLTLFVMTGLGLAGAGTALLRGRR